MRHKMVADPNPQSVFLLFQVHLERQKHSQIPNLPLGVFIEHAFALGHEIRNVCRIFPIVFVPPAIQKFPIPLQRHAGGEHHKLRTLDQMLPKGLVVIPRGLQSKDDLAQPLLGAGGTLSTSKLFPLDE